MTSAVESTQQKTNDRTEGTGKSWRDAWLGPFFQLKADKLNETHNCDVFSQRRGTRDYRFWRRHRTTSPYIPWQARTCKLASAMLESYQHDANTCPRLSPWVEVPRKLEP